MILNLPEADNSIQIKSKMQKKRNKRDFHKVGRGEGVWTACMKRGQHCDGANSHQNTISNMPAKVNIIIKITVKFMSKQN